MQVFIHRGKEYDRLDDFRNRMMDQHINAELMNKLSPPSDEVKESSGQCMLTSAILCKLELVDF